MPGSFTEARKRQLARLQGAKPPTARAAVALAKSQAYQDAADASVTLRAYAADLANFEAWCGKHGFQAATPEIVGAYLAAAGEGYALPTLRRRVAAIARACSVAGHPLDTKHPAIRETLRGIGRKHGTPCPTDSGPDHGRDQEAESACGTTLAGARDRTLFLPHSGQPPPPPRRRAPSRRRPSAALHRFGQHQRMRPPLSTKWLQQPSVRQTEGLREATARRPAWTVQCSPSPGMRSSQIGLPQPHGQSITAWNGCSCPPTM